MSPTETLSSFVASLRGRKIHVVGLASTECTAFLRALSDRGVGGAVVHDFAPDREALGHTFATTHVALPPPERAALLSRLLDEATDLRLRDRYLEGVGDADVVYVSQAWDLYPENAPIAALLEAHPERIITLMDLTVRLLPCPVIGVTGTNGKTTVTSMIGSLLEAAGIEVAIGGNHRYHDQILPRIDTISPEAVAVLEISHKHLLRLERGPAVAVVTNVSGDHLDQLPRAEYEARKGRLVSTQDAAGLAVLNGDDPVCLAMAEHAPGQVVLFGLGAQPEPHDPGAFVDGNRLVVRTLHGEVSIPRSAVRVPGEHNLRNTLAALAAVSPWVREGATLERGVRAFRGVKHRLEYLRRIGGIPVYDDTAATSPSATEAALRALRGEGFERIVLLAGGDDKLNEYDGLHRAIRDCARALVLLPGTASDLMAGGVKELPVDRHTDLESALAAALALAQKGDALLISPGGAGFHTHFAEGDETKPGLRTLIRRWGRSSARG